QITSARSTLAAAMSARIASMRPCSSGKVRWQCESTNTTPLWRGAGQRRVGSDCLSRLGRLQLRAQQLFNLEFQQTRLFVAGESNADTLGAATRRVGWRDPGD